MSSLEDKLPPPFAESLAYLRAQRDSDARVDAIDANFAYIWVSNIVKNEQDEEPGGWIRLPLAFPFANPHGLVTKAALKRKGEGTVADGHNSGHEMCNPVGSIGGAHYYSWTWQGAPALRAPEDIVGVVQWYERRIRNG